MNKKHTDSAQSPIGNLAVFDRTQKNIDILQSLATGRGVKMRNAVTSWQEEGSELFVLLAFGNAVLYAVAHDLHMLPDVLIRVAMSAQERGYERLEKAQIFAGDVTMDIVKPLWLEVVAACTAPDDGVTGKEDVPALESEAPAGALLH